MTKVKFPLLLLNLKTYRESLGKKALRFASISDKIAKKTGVCIALAPQLVDLRMVVKKTESPVFSQHIDPVSFGKFTGHVPPEAVIDAGCSGTLINHSERKLERHVVKNAVERARELNLFSVVCVETPDVAKTVMAFYPDAVAIEPPELIGTGISVSRAKPEVITNAVDIIKKNNPQVRVLCGAGVSNGNDVQAALRLGAEGVLLASGVVKAKDPSEKLFELASAMNIE